MSASVEWHIGVFTMTTQTQNEDRTTQIPWITRWVFALLMCALVGLPARAAEKAITPIEKLTTEYAGKFVTVEGSITGLRKFKSGMRYTLDDGTGKVTLVLFDRELRQVPKRDQLSDGAKVNVTGKVDFFKEEAQIVPMRGTDVVVIAPAPVISPTAIRDVRKDTTALVQGLVTEATNFSAGFKLMINDGTGALNVTLFEDTFDALPDAARLNVGATLKVKGKVSDYRGALEIVPDSVTVVETKPREVRKYDLSAISGNDHNAVVQIEGDIASMTPFADGVDVLVTDAQGAQSVRLWNVVAKRVKLKVSDKVVVIGRVRANKKGITIDVAMPGDIQVKK